MLTKEKLEKAIDSLPDEFTVEEVIEKLMFIDKIEQGIKNINDGDVYTFEEVKEKIDIWF